MLLFYYFFPLVKLPGSHRPGERGGYTVCVQHKYDELVAAIAQLKRFWRPCGRSGWPLARSYWYAHVVNIIYALVASRYNDGGNQFFYVTCAPVFLNFFLLPLLFIALLSRFISFPSRCYILLLLTDDGNLKSCWPISIVPSSPLQHKTTIIYLFLFPLSLFLVFNTFICNLKSGVSWTG